MIEIYKKLCQITNDNLHQYDPQISIHFEHPQGLAYSIFSYPKQELLDIEDAEEFIRESFYKILDRAVDENNFKKYVPLIKNKKLSKEDLLKELYASGERTIKQTQII